MTGFFVFCPLVVIVGGAYNLLSSKILLDYKLFMKKIFLAVLVSVLVPISAGAMTNPVGCAAGYNFSPVTGERCTVVSGGGGGSTAACHTFNYDLQFGDGGATVVGGLSKESDVRALQQFLVAKGYGGTEVQNEMKGGSVFEEGTAAAVVKFQGAYGIRQTGYVGPLTRGQLNRLCVPALVGGIGEQTPIDDEEEEGDNADFLSVTNPARDGYNVPLKMKIGSLPKGATGFALKTECFHPFIAFRAKISGNSVSCGSYFWVDPNQSLELEYTEYITSGNSTPVKFILNAFDDDGNFINYNSKEVLISRGKG